MNERVYFDWNATAPLRPQARAALVAAFELTGNPSSIHAEGRAVRQAIETARAQVGALVGVEARRVTFTSGATEANMLALTPALALGGRAAPRDWLFYSATEHPSVRTGGRFPAEAVEVLPVDGNGLLDLEALKGALARAERPLVSVMLANNETGVIQPIAEIAAIVHAAGGLLHVDAVQGAGRIEFAMDMLGADLMTLASHKLGGPQGIGALICRADLHIEDPLIRGGGQERGLRAGTENAAAIIGFGATCAAARAGREVDAPRMRALRDRLEGGLKRIAPDTVVFGAGAARLPNTALFAAPGVRSDTAVISFDLNGIALSAGSACSSGKVQASPVLAAMGVDPELGRCALRASLGWTTTENDVEKLLTAWRKVVSSLRKKQTNDGIAA
ncbi:MAG TPA: cysteine desulfurase family protein [Pseudolabrys sp.]|nr:cysteine desulfurase family protein [Pseudolabrys sp.]